MFRDGNSRAEAGGASLDFIEHELAHALAGMNPRNATVVSATAGRIVSGSDFTSAQAAEWRKRFADRLAELQSTAQKAA
jgi:hypothetical protein